MTVDDLADASVFDSIYYCCILVCLIISFVSQVSYSQGVSVTTVVLGYI